jgi:hypothetical protein
MWVSIGQAVCCSVWFHCSGKFTHEDGTKIIFMLTTFIRSHCDIYVIKYWKCQERSGSDVIRSGSEVIRSGNYVIRSGSDVIGRLNIKYCNETHNHWSSTWYLKLGFSHRKTCGQPMDRVFVHVNLTDSNVIPTALSVRRSEISQLFCRCSAHFNGLPKVRYSIRKVRLSLSVCPSELKNLYEKVWWLFEIRFKKLMFHQNQTRNFENGLLISLWLSVRPSVRVSSWNNTSDTE